MPGDEEESFTVRDRRRFLTEEADAPAPEPPAGNVASPDPSPIASDLTEEDEDALAQELPDVHSVLALFLNELRNLAWIRMGLVANPISGQIERDLAQAQVAIDTVAFLASQIESVVPTEERLPLRALVSDLQINFVEQSKRV